MEATASVQQREMTVQLVIHTLSAKADFRQLFAMRSAIEQEAGETLDWREAPEKVQSRIQLRRDADLSDEDSWPELFDWLIAKLEVIHRVFAPRVRALKLAEEEPESSRGE